MNETRQVAVITMLSFVMFTIGNGYKHKQFQLPESQQLAAWGILFIVLLAFTDIPSTGEIAAAIAWLLFLTVALVYGVDLADKINEWVGAK